MDSLNSSNPNVCPWCEQAPWDDTPEHFANEIPSVSQTSYTSSEQLTEKS